MDDTTKDLHKKIKASLKREKIDALLVSQPANRRYLSGYTATDSSISESSGLLLIPVKGTPYLLTDSRYTLQAEHEVSGFDVVLYPHGLLALLGKMLPNLAVKRLAFESHYTLHAMYQKLEKKTAKLGIELVPVTGFVEKLRVAKSEEELGLIRRAVLLNETVFQEAFNKLKPGMTEKEAARLIENTMRIKGAECPSFETIVAGGPNGAMPHAVPTDRPLQQGEPIIIDMGLVLDGYCSDMTRTVFLGEPDQRAVELARIVRKAQLAATNAIRAGKKASDIDRAARDIIKKAGYGDKFGHGLGHGVGLAVHEAPAVNRRNHKKLQAGMVITVEPGIYIPGWGGIRLENMVVVTEKGCEVLNKDTTFLNV
jgi:Xaa-Pro aminopeptidase